MPKKINSPPKELIESTHAFLRKEGCGVEHLVNIQKPNKPKIVLAPIANPYDVDPKVQFARHDKYASQTIVVPEGKYFSDVFGESFKRWALGDVIFENVRCGCGKTKSFRDSLGYFKCEGYKVLYVSPREQLMRQTKLSVAKKLGSEYKNYSPESLDPLKSIDNFVFFETYQGLAQVYERNSKFRRDVFDGKNKVVVYLDECHWLTSDALFSSQPENFMPGLIRQFPNAILVFMTATDCDCFEPITKAIPRTGKRKVIEGYHCKTLEYPDVRYDKVFISAPLKQNADFFFFDEYDDLIKRINSSESKWIMLVSSKELGEKLKAEIQGAEFVYRETEGYKMTDSALEEKQSISLFERFNCRVLITTAILDVGTNVNDRELKNVVIDVWDPVQAVQFVGRKRGNDRFNLYLHNLNISRVKELLITRVDEPLQRMKELVEASDAEVSSRNDELAEEIKAGRIYSRNGKLCYNRLARKKLLNLRRYLRHVLWEVDKYGEQSLLAHQAELFGHTLGECQDILKETKQTKRNELINYLDSLEGKELGKEEYIEFCKKFDDLLTRLTGKKWHRGAVMYQEDKLNKIFAENGLDFRATNKEKSGIYVISRISD